MMIMGAGVLKESIPLPRTADEARRLARSKNDAARSKRRSADQAHAKRIAAVSSVRRARAAGATDESDYRAIVKRLVDKGSMTAAEGDQALRDAGYSASAARPTATRARIDTDRVYRDRAAVRAASSKDLGTLGTGGITRTTAKPLEPVQPPPKSFAAIAAQVYGAAPSDADAALIATSPRGGAR